MAAFVVYPVLVLAADCAGCAFAPVAPTDCHAGFGDFLFRTGAGARWDV